MSENLHIFAAQRPELWQIVSDPVDPMDFLTKECVDIRFHWRLIPPEGSPRRREAAVREGIMTLGNAIALSVTEWTEMIPSAGWNLWPFTDEIGAYIRFHRVDKVAHPHHHPD